MATLTGRKPSESYKDLLQISNANSGIDTIERAIEDGEGTSTILKLSSTSVDIDNSSSNTFKIAGTTLTATATELNYSSGVSSNIQTQLNSKMTSLSTSQDSFLVGGSLANSVVSKTATEVRTMLGMGTGYALNVGTSINNLVQHGASSSTDGFAHISSGKVISKTATESRTSLGLGLTDSVRFSNLNITNSIDIGNVKFALLSAPLTANSTNVGKLFYWSLSVGATGQGTRKRYLSVIMQSALNAYSRVDLAEKSWTPVAGE